MSNEVDYTGFGGSSRPQEGRNDIINASLDSLNLKHSQVGSKK